jgi:hypothetical protein
LFNILKKRKKEKIILDREVFGMNKVLKKVGLSAVVATMVFGLAGVSSALTVQDPDNETANITANADVFVEATNDATYSETEDYTLLLDNVSRNGTDGKTGLTYTKDFASTNGQTHVVSDFAAVGSADKTTQNIKTSNKITFNTMYEGLNAGTFTGTEKIQYQRCKPDQTIKYATFCGSNTAATPKATGDVAAGSSFDVQYAAVTTGADVTAVGDNSTLIPSLNYSIDARGLGVIAQNDNAIGSVKAGMKANITEYNDDKATTTLSYEQHTAAKGLVKFTKTMKYSSVIPAAGALKTNLDKVP